MSAISIQLRPTHHAAGSITIDAKPFTTFHKGDDVGKIKTVGDAIDLVIKRGS